MVAKYLLIPVAVAALAAEGGAQGANASATNTPLFVGSIQETQRPRQGQGVADSRVKECPMPVQRPDTSRLIRMPNVHLSPSVTDPMPRLELNCPNPLDPGRHIQRSPDQRSPNLGYPKEF